MNSPSGPHRTLARSLQYYFILLPVVPYVTITRRGKCTL